MVSVLSEKRGISAAKSKQLPTLMGRELLSVLCLGAGAVTLRAVAQRAHSASLLSVDIVLGQNGWAAVL